MSNLLLVYAFCWTHFDELCCWWFTNHLDELLFLPCHHSFQLSMIYESLDELLKIRSEEFCCFVECWRTSSRFVLLYLQCFFLLSRSLWSQTFKLTVLVTELVDRSFSLYLLWLQDFCWIGLSCVEETSSRRFVPAAVAGF